MRVLGRPEGSGGPGARRRPGLGGRTGRRLATREGAGNPPDRAFATATLVAAVVVVLAGTLGTLWLRGWGRVGFEVPSMPWYFSFPFYVFPGPQLELGWTAATLPVVAATVAATLAAHRGLVQRSASWTVAGGVLLWASSMLTYAAVLLLVFLGVRAFGLLRHERVWVVCWAAGTSAVVVALAGGLWLATGYDVPAAVAAVHGAYQAAPGSAGRSLAVWLPGDLLAFGGMLGVPLLAALAGRTVTVVRQLLAWRVRAPAVIGLLVAQTLLVQVLFHTRW